MKRLLATLLLATTAVQAAPDLARLTAVEAKIADKTYKDITSILVLQDGKTVYEHYFNGSTVDTLNDARSATKSITALLVGAAIDRHLISGVDAPVYGFFPGHKPADPQLQKTTLEDLLTMSSLWECNDENEFSSGNEERMYVTAHWLDFALALPLKGFAPWMDKPAESPFGRSFSYCTAGAFVAGAAVERAAKMPLSAFAAQALEQPLGITSVKWNRAPEGIGMGGGGTRYRTRDLAKFAQLVLDGGRWEGRQVISADYIKAMTSPHAQAREDAEYGYLWWHFHFKVDGKDVAAWSMSGNGGNYVLFVPQWRVVAVVTSKAYNQRYAHPQSREIISNYILKATQP